MFKFWDDVPRYEMDMDIDLDVSSLIHKLAPNLIRPSMKIISNNSSISTYYSDSYIPAWSLSKDHVYTYNILGISYQDKCNLQKYFLYCMRLIRGKVFNHYRDEGGVAMFTLCLNSQEAKIVVKTLDNSYLNLFLPNSFKVFKDELTNYDPTSIDILISQSSDKDYRVLSDRYVAASFNMYRLIHPEETNNNYIELTLSPNDSNYRMVVKGIDYYSALDYYCAVTHKSRPDNNKMVIKGVSLLNVPDAGGVRLLDTSDNSVMSSQLHTLGTRFLNLYLSSDLPDGPYLVHTDKGSLRFDRLVSFNN